MRTLLITLEYPPFKGGVANYYFNLAKYWPLGENIKIIDNSKNELMAQSGRFPWFRAVTTLIRQQKRKSFDHLLVGHILPLGTAALLAAFIRPFSFSVFLHGLDFSAAVSSYRKSFLTKLILRQAENIICANSYTADLVHRFDKKIKNKIQVVNPGIEPIIPDKDCDKLEEIKSQYGLEGKFVLFSLGRLVARKGFDTVIKAISHNEFKLNNLVYFIAGSGPQEKELKTLAAASPLKDKIFFLGGITEDDKWCWFHACDAFILPARMIGSDFEGFGIVYLEANLAGKPVIAGDSGGIRDAISDGVSGLLVEPEDLFEIRMAIERLAADSALRAELGNKGRERAVTKFRWDNQAAKICTILKN